MTVTADSDSDFIRTVFLWVAVCLRQPHVKLCQATIGGGQHQKNQNNKQDIDERDQVNFRF